MDIIRGSLDGITRSASSHQRQRPDSSVSLHSGTASPALRLDVSNSFEILPPEQEFQYEVYNCLGKLILMYKHLRFALKVQYLL